MNKPTKKTDYISYSPQTGDIYEEKRVSVRDAVVNVIFVAFILFTIISSAFSSIYTLSLVKGPSMMPTLNSTGQNNSDIVYVNRFSAPELGGIVVIKKTDIYLVKRVIGLPGDTINIIENQNYVPYNPESGDDFDYLVHLQHHLIRNGEVVDESGYLNYVLQTTRLNKHFDTFNDEYKPLNTERVDAETGSITVGPNEIFLLGDNRQDSQDSSKDGPYLLSRVLGRVEIIVKYQTGVVEHYNQKIMGMIRMFGQKLLSR